jgi:hypothetical protein
MIKSFFVAAVFAAVLSLQPVAAGAVDLKFNSSDTLQANLGRNVGKKAELVLISGKSVTGTIKEVGSASVYLTALEGKEFFDSLVRNDQIAAVVLRAK